MKKKGLLFLLLIACIVPKLRAQGLAADTAFRFTHRISRSVNNWIVFPKQADIDAYPFGYLYIDPSSGFVFNLEGFFKTDGRGRFIRIKQKINEATHQRYMLKRGAQKTLVAIINSDHNEELDIYPRPAWFDNYNTYTDTLVHCIDWAKAYNDIKDGEMAVAILKAPYKITPHAPGLELELARAYNGVKRFDDAIKVAEAALLYNYGEPLLYKELGFAQLSKGRLNEALDTFNAGIKLCDRTQAEEKAEMAMNMAITYRSKNDKQNYLEWMDFARAWAPHDSEVADMLNDM
ncbi:hypothetical protein BDD43_1016 [Mucilaginibacter gracilis]|uniref:Uncharacterized protein n=1 Tax=Mucilaginibacter gracilis TaxID=423350 RepID=A0A495IYH8_9SPHI|nr:hypothetical protein [Mucilaginibacter gracilis]RKR80879.1 hypothetical protein BDD43_1016 [Mucilaginibacter gracilis]